MAVDKCKEACDRDQNCKGFVQRVKEAGLGYVIMQQPRMIVLMDATSIIVGILLVIFWKSDLEIADIVDVGER